MMRTLGRLVGLIAVVAGLGCTSGPKGDTLNGTWQGSGATDDVLQVTQTGDDVAGKILEGGSQVGSVSGTDVAGQVTLQMVIYQFETPDGTMDNAQSTYSGRFVNSNTVVGTASDSPSSTTTFTRQ